jgi:hypothetical protein
VRWEWVDERIAQQSWLYNTFTNTLYSLVQPTEHLLVQRTLHNSTTSVGGTTYIIHSFGESSMITNTKYVHIKSTTVYAPRRNWDSPQPPTRRLVCPLPPVSGGRGTLAGEKGVGRVPIPTVVLFICTYFVITNISLTYVSYRVLYGWKADNQRRYF